MLRAVCYAVLYMMLILTGPVLSCRMPSPVLPGSGRDLCAVLDCVPEVLKSSCPEDAPRRLERHRYQHSGPVEAAGVFEVASEVLAEHGRLECTNAELNDPTDHGINFDGLPLTDYCGEFDDDDDDEYDDEFVDSKSCADVAAGSDDVPSLLSMCGAMEMLLGRVRDESASLSPRSRFRR